MNPLQDDEIQNEMIDDWTERKMICVLGAGMRPLTPYNKDKFIGLENVKTYEAVNVDIIDYDSTDVIQDLSLEKWRIESNQFDVVVAEHCAEHVPHRISFIKECLRIAKTGGLVIIEVPNWSHETAHSNLEHLTTWSRMIFDDSYINGFGQLWKVEKVVYRITIPIIWKSFYIKNEFVGRQIDRFTSLISGLRFFLIVK